MYSRLKRVFTLVTFSILVLFVSLSRQEECSLPEIASKTTCNVTLLDNTTICLSLSPPNNVSFCDVKMFPLTSFNTNCSLESHIYNETDCITCEEACNGCYGDDERECIACSYAHYDGDCVTTCPYQTVRNSKTLACENIFISPAPKVTRIDLIIGVTIGVLVFVILLIILIVYCILKTRRKQEDIESPNSLPSAEEVDKISRRLAKEKQMSRQLSEDAVEKQNENTRYVQDPIAAFAALEQKNSTKSIQEVETWKKQLPGEQEADDYENWNTDTLGNFTHNNAAYEGENDEQEIYKNQAVFPRHPVDTNSPSQHDGPHEIYENYTTEIKPDSRETENHYMNTNSDSAFVCGTYLPDKVDEQFSLQSNEQREELYGNMSVVELEMNRR